MEEHNLIRIDISKLSFQICQLDQHQQVVFNKKVLRSKLLHTLRQFEPTTVVMEACYSAHYWGRTIEALGHQVKLVPPFQVKPFLVGNKNDHNDAIAIAEAALRPKTRFVKVKSLQQQDLQVLQRTRERWLKHRTAAINQIRGFLSEYGIVVARTPARLIAALPGILGDANSGLTPVSRRVIQDLFDEVIGLSDRINRIEADRNQLVGNTADYQRLLTIRGVGPAIAAELIATVGDAKQFANGRQMAAWIGLTPRHYASGDTHVTGHISKRGNRSLRRLLIHGARALINWCDNQDDRLNQWIRGLLARMHPCKAIVAIANKLARIAWAVLTRHENYRAIPA